MVCVTIMLLQGENAVQSLHHSAGKHDDLKMMLLMMIIVTKDNKSDYDLMIFEDGKDCNKKVIGAWLVMMLLFYIMMIMMLLMTIKMTIMILSASISVTRRQQLGMFIQGQGGLWSDVVGHFLENDEEIYDAVFTKATFYTRSFMIRLKYVHCRPGRNK